jgi:hypothetical protein
MALEWKVMAEMAPKKSAFCEALAASRQMSFHSASILWFQRPQDTQC